MRNNGAVSVSRSMNRENDKKIKMLGEIKK